MLILKLYNKLKVNILSVSWDWIILSVHLTKAVTFPFLKAFFWSELILKSKASMPLWWKQVLFGIACTVDILTHGQFIVTKTSIENNKPTTKFIDPKKLSQILIIRIEIKWHCQNYERFGDFDKTNFGWVALTRAARKRAEIQVANRSRSTCSDCERVFSMVEW